MTGDTRSRGGGPDRLRRGPRRPAFIDEIHRAPDLLLALKQSVDADTTPGRFPITGSANVLASRKVKDALPGRIDRVQMWPLAQREIQDGGLNLVDELFAGRAPRVTGADVGHRAFSAVVTEAGYPEARLRPSGRRRTRWFANYIAQTDGRRDRHGAALDRVALAIASSAFPGRDPERRCERVARGGR
jgi:predicted AAA+ superfamily ATPase